MATSKDDLMSRYGKFASMDSTQIVKLTESNQIVKLADSSQIMKLTDNSQVMKL